MYSQRYAPPALTNKIYFVYIKGSLFVFLLIASG